MGDTDVPNRLEQRRHEKRTIAAPTQEQREAIVGFVDREYRDDHPVRVTVRALLHTGLRNAELAHLTPDKVYEHSGAPTVEVSPVDCSCSYCERQARINDKDMWRPKTSAADRLATVHDRETFELMRDAGAFGVTPSAIGRRVGKVQERFGFEPEVTPHVLRHGHATWLHEAGVPINSIADQLGHVSSETTRVYIQESYSKRASRDLELTSG
jgi:integrase